MADKKACFIVKISEKLKFISMPDPNDSQQTLSA